MSEKTNILWIHPAPYNSTLFTSLLQATPINTSIEWCHRLTSAIGRVETKQFDHIVIDVVTPPVESITAGPNVPIYASFDFIQVFRRSFSNSGTPILAYATIQDPHISQLLEQLTKRAGAYDFVNTTNAIENGYDGLISRLTRTLC